MRVVGREFSNILDTELDNLVHQVWEVTPSAIRHQQLDALQRDCGFCWNDIACILRVPDRTLRRRRDEFGMRVVGREFSNISDTELDNLVHQVREVTPSAIRHQQLDALHRDCGFCWNDIACILRVSDSTLRRRRDEFGMRVVGRKFSNIPDTELDNLVHQVREVTASADLRMVQGSLRQGGLVVQRIHVLQSLCRVDPVTTTLKNATWIIRRRYNVPCPTSLW